MALISWPDVAKSLCSFGGGRGLGIDKACSPLLLRPTVLLPIPSCDAHHPCPTSTPALGPLAWLSVPACGCPWFRFILISAIRFPCADASSADLLFVLLPYRKASVGPQLRLAWHRLGGLCPCTIPRAFSLQKQSSPSVSFHPLDQVLAFVLVVSPPILYRDRAESAFPPPFPPFLL